MLWGTLAKTYGHCAPVSRLIDRIRTARIGMVPAQQATLPHLETHLPEKIGLDPDLRLFTVFEAAPVT